MIYLDNSSTTRIKPNSVLMALIDGATKFSANPGRSGHKLSISAAMEVTETREILREFFGAEKLENVIFTSGCTEALNLAIIGYAKQGGHVVATAFDHNSTLRPLFELKKQGIIDVSIVSPENPEIVTLEDIKKEIKPNTYMVVTTHVANVDGATSDIEKIGKFCKENNLIYLVDAAQSAGHKRINMQKQNINLLALAGHKGLLAYQGIGALIINDCSLPKPIKFGGTGTDSISVYQPTEPPECYESGTVATPNILALKAGVKFVSENFDNIEQNIENLTKMLLNELKKLKNVKIYTSPNNLNGVIAFNFKDIDSTVVASFLDEKYNICVRGGLQCAPLKHKYLGTEKQGVVRVSLSYFTNEKEINKLVRALNDFDNQISE